MAEDSTGLQRSPSYTAGLQAGHAVLDSLRAVRSFTPGGITAANPVELYGYSGGGQATGWGAELPPSYAPEITLTGRATGGTPADPEARFLDGGLFAGFEAAVAYSYRARDGVARGAGEGDRPPERPADREDPDPEFMLTAFSWVATALFR